jgi:hypothetical protein
MIEFRADTHEYILDGKKLISVTQLLQKHGLAPNYGDVPAEVLKAKAERGNLIHAEIERYCKYAEMGFSEELYNFIDYIKTHSVTVTASERMLYNELVAGTADLLLFENGEAIIADIKTTTRVHTEAVSWQLSLYAFLHEQTTGEMIDKGEVYHFNAEGELTVTEIPLKPYAEVIRLLECERNGEIYKAPLIVSETQLAEVLELERVIKQIEEQKKQAEAKAAELRTALMSAMEQSGCTSFENDNIKITYVAATTRASVDSTRLKKDLPEIAQRYTKTSTVKPSLRITIKGAEV